MKQVKTPDPHRKKKGELYGPDEADAEGRSGFSLEHNLKQTSFRCEMQGILFCMRFTHIMDKYRPSTPPPAPLSFGLV